jgi:CDP-glycerol glycerophosphotransferase (TagB/SpsB family)
VLYAPTWEGWTDDPGNTSVILAGENIVSRLVAAEPPVRVLYKPHPFTGTRSPVAKRAHERIVAVLEKAAAQRAGAPGFAGQAAAEADARAAAKAELARIKVRLDGLGDTARAGADDAENSRDDLADPGREAESARLRADWNDAYWRSLGSWEHKVVTGPMPHLYDCFNVADAMVSDISSVVSDFIASGKPYAIADSAGLGATEFKRQNTAARAAFVLGNDASGIDELLLAVTDEANDPTLTAREDLKQYLLGPDRPASIVRFNDAVRDLAAKADARLARLPQEEEGIDAAEDELAAVLPGQRDGELVADGDMDDTSAG